MCGSYEYNNIINTIEPFMEKGVSIRYTFNNHLINTQMTSDWTCNRIMEITDSYNKEDSKLHNGCTMSSQVLFDYIKEVYPKFERVWSTTTYELQDREGLVDKINKLTEEDMIVLPYQFNKDFELLKELEHPENIELLCIDEGCQDNCPYRNEHYLVTDEGTLLYKPGQFSRIDFSDVHGQCRHEGRTPYYYSNTYNQKYVIKIDDIENTYLPMGFNKYKISGRSSQIGMVFALIECYVNYLVKPEFRDEMRNILLVDNFFLGDMLNNIAR